MASVREDGSGRRGVFDVDEGRALEILRLAWDGAYGEFRVEQGEPFRKWKAVSMDAERRKFAGSTPDELNVRLRADWAGWCAP
jgi:hypothetical protein